MIFHSKSAMAILALISGLSFTTASIAASDNAQRENETSGVAPDKTSRSAGEAQSEGTGEGRATPAEKTPKKITAADHG